MDQLTLRWFSRDLNTRGTAVAGALSDSIEDAIASGSAQRVQALFERAARDERLVAIAMCSSDEALLRHSSAFPMALTCAEARAVSRPPRPAPGTGHGGGARRRVPGQCRARRAPAAWCCCTT